MLDCFSNLEKRIEIENLNVLIFSSLENAFNYIEHKRKEYGKVFIVGGQSLYNECIKRLNNYIEFLKGLA